MHWGIAQEACKEHQAYIARPPHWDLRLCTHCVQCAGPSEPDRGAKQKLSNPNACLQENSARARNIKKHTM